MKKDDVIQMLQNDQHKKIGPKADWHEIFISASKG